MGTHRTPDEIAGAQTSALGLHVARLSEGEEDEEKFVLIQGSREALSFLADVIRSVANSESLPAGFSMGPASAGRFHFADSATEGLYISCVEASSDAGACERGKRSDG